MIEDGLSVDVICLRHPEEARTETIRGVKVHRLPVERHRGGRARYVWEYALFLVLSTIVLTILHACNRFRLIHVHNLPDFLVFSALVPKLMGARVILDLHDPMPESLMTKYRISDSHPGIRLSRWVEKHSIRFADQVVTPNEAFRRLFVSRGCPAEKIHVVMNSPQESIFHTEEAAPATRRPMKGELKLMFHGTLVERHGLATSLEAVSRLRKDVPGLRFEVYGEGDFVERFLELVEEKDLSEVVNYHGHVSIEEIARSIPHVDIGLIPNDRSAFTEINLPTRIFEYLCIGKPVVAPRTEGILDYFDDDSLHFFEPGDAESLRHAILEVYSDPCRRNKVLDRGRDVYSKYRWEKEKKRFLGIVMNLLYTP